MTMIGEAFDWCVRVGVGVEKKLREAFEVRVSGGDRESRPLDGRAVVRWFGEWPAVRAEWTDGVTRTGPFALGLAFAAAAAGVLFFVSTQRDADATVATAVDAVEVIE